MSIAKPWLAEPGYPRVLAFGECFSQKLLARTGEWALSSEREVPIDLPEEALPFFAREIAIRSPGKRPSQLEAALENCPLAGDGSPSLRELGDNVISCALFPMTSSASASLGLLVDAGAGRPFFAGPPMSTDSQSWELAWELCQQFKKDTKYRLALAAEWLVTGRCGPDGRVRPILMGVKTSVKRCSHRIFMLPPDNLQDFEASPGMFQRRVTACNLPSALAHVKGKGTTDSGEPEPWPQKIDELHSFVSESVKPICLLSLLADSAPLHLWCSGNAEKSRGVANWLEPFLTKDLKLPFRVTTHEKDVPDDSVAGAERFLDQALGESLKAGKTLLFNFTQGNKLMAMGITELARRHANLWLIYRNTDSKQMDPLSFDLVNYPQGQPYTRRVEVSFMRDDVNLEKLLSFSRPTSREEARKELLIKTKA
ncbi:MAG: hypothetical protein JJU29_12720 [Verrucomicrobia bacterium]|nr:hypothetical protein [Verrucomicrobiota bacterium]